MKKIQDLEASSQIERDKQLVAMMQTGSRADKENAFNLLYARYKASIHYNIYKTLKNKQDVGDLVQEVFAKIYEKISLYQPDHAFSTWLFTIAKNMVIDFKRKEKSCTVSIDEVINMGDDEDMELQIPDKNAHDPLKTCLINESNEAIAKAILSVKSKNSREVITLVFIKQMSYKNVAEIKGLPVGTIKAIIFRGKKELKKHIENFCPDMAIIPFLSDKYMNYMKKSKNK